MYLFILIILTSLSLIVSFLLTAMNSAIKLTPQQEIKKQLSSLGNVFFYQSLLSSFFPSKEFEALNFTLMCAQHIVRFCYAALGIAILMDVNFFTSLFNPSTSNELFLWLPTILFIFFLIAISFFVGDFIPRIIGTRYPITSLRLCALPSSLFLTILLPLSGLFLKISKTLFKSVYIEHFRFGKAKVSEEIMEIIQEADVEDTLGPHDKKLISSVMTFRDRIAREVMVPRVDIFSLPGETTIREATGSLINEGYSRIPVYRNTIDNIIGVLMYKDIVNKYHEYEKQGLSKILDAPIESIVKNVLYTPENKKISQLLQEFRKKQVHLAIVVDEYGGTEGIVTIEDILEEIVGEIADEYDDETSLFFPLPDGGWIVDAKMNILDIDEQLGLKIPQDGDYDTLGGYIFQKAGSIPSKGFVIHHNDFELEVLSSSDRSIDKVRFKPRHSSNIEEHTQDK